MPQFGGMAGLTPFLLLGLVCGVWGEVTDVNVARKPLQLRQLGTSLVRGRLMTPDLAVDGIWSVHPYLCATTALPDNEDSAPYWRIQLEHQVTINEIHIMFRYDRLHQHRVYYVKVDGRPCYTRENPALDPGRIERIQCTNRTAASVVEISIPSQKGSKSEKPPVLSLCEVAIYATGCTRGTYGPTCQDKCGYCKGGMDYCDMRTGICKGGCDGSFVGERCTGADVARNQAGYHLGSNRLTSGLEIDGNTNTEILRECETIDRQATGNKELGWKLQLTRNVTVSEVIIYTPKDDKGKRGVGSIRINVGPYVCAVHNSQTSASGEALSIPCQNQPAALGADIVITNTDPNVLQMVLCEVHVVVCPQGMWGDLCTRTCPRCQEGKQCNPTNGVCEPCPRNKCSPYYLMPSTAGEIIEESSPLDVKNCGNGKWGRKCSLPCNCRDAQENCYALDGSCKSGCPAGYEGINCLKVCDPLTYGRNCDSECHCKDHRERCNPTTGKCHTGCDVRYTGQSCEQGPPPVWVHTPDIFNCDHGQFGPHCGETCNCRDKTEPCIKYNGACPQTGCAAGFTGTSCHQDCSDGTFSYDCQKECRCLDKKEVCNKVTGECPLSGCASGFTGPDCYTPCKVGFYGPGCATPCRCSDPEEVCDPQEGTCLSGCQIGYDPEDTSCNKTCPSGRYGTNCLVECGNCKDTCHHVTGICPGDCVDGYQGTYCTKECDTGKYGPECSRKCNCKDPEEKCNHITGACPISQCPAGKMGTACDKECTKGTYGENCEKTCGECLGGNYNCDINTGKCTVGCLPTHNGTNCDHQCPEGRHGPDCKSPCGECFKGQCQDDGTCHREQCEAGFTGPKCANVCPSNKYGWNCEKDCGHCVPGACNASTGSCIGPCQEGYTGVKCNQACNATEVCEILCGNCEGGDTNCNKKTGTCTNGCERGWHGPDCSSDCPPGSYGPGCNQECGYCKEGRDKCHPKNGECPDKQCHHAYETALCNKVIDPTCLVYNVCIPCGHCYNGREECNFQTGECKGDCKPGWEYKNCSVRCRRLTYGFRCNHICNCTGECACNAETGHCDDHCVIYMNDNAYVFAVHARLQETLQLLPIILPTLIVAMTIATIIFGWRRRKAKHERMLFSFKPFGENEMKFLSATNKPPQ